MEAEANGCMLQAPLVTLPIFVSSDLTQTWPAQYECNPACAKYTHHHGGGGGGGAVGASNPTRANHEWRMPLSKRLQPLAGHG